MRARLPAGTPTPLLDDGRRRVARSAAVPSQPRDALQQRRERRRRSQQQLGERVAAAARLEEPLAQVQQVAARLHFAGRRRSPGRRGARRTGRRRRRGVIGEDGAELERKRVERSPELVRGDEQRRRQAGIVPRRRPVPTQARRSSADRPSTTASVGRRGRRRRSRVVDDQRPQADRRRSRADRDRAREPRRECP